MTMPNRERERIGPFVVTGESNLSPDGIICAQCQKLLSTYDTASDTHTPSAEMLLSQGSVPIPNFGWFCSQACAIAYETEFNLHFQRNHVGKIAYYDDLLSDSHPPP